LKSPGFRIAWFLWWAVWAAIALPWWGIDSEAHWDRVAWFYWPWRYVPRRDAILNLLFFVPFGFLGKSRGWGGASTVAVAAAVALATEAVQLYAPYRFPSALDVVMNVAGAIVGVACARWTATRSR
jgi:hypothetical protein